MTVALGTALAAIAASSQPMTGRAHSLLGELRDAVPFDAAWLVFADPHGAGHVLLASVGAGVDRGAAAPVDDLSVAPGGAGRPQPAEAFATWVATRIPVGLCAPLVIPLLAPGDRLVGFLAVFSTSPSVPSQTTRRRMTELAPVLALGVDPMRCLCTVARLVSGVTAGRVLRSDGQTAPLPGLDGDPVLADDSLVVAAASQRLEAGLTHSSFLWPVGGWHARETHVRVTVLAAPDDLPAVLAGLVLVSPAPDLHDLTPRELEVLGLLVAGCSNQEIARALVVATRTVAAHVEHLLVKLHVTTRTLAAVLAEREGLHVPAVPELLHGEPRWGERYP